MATIAELAQMSSNVYAGTLLDAQNDTLLLHSLPPGWVVLDNSNSQTESYWEDGYFGVAYYNPTTGEVVIANRGTLPLGSGSPSTTILNALSDVKLGLGFQFSVVQQDAALFAQQVMNDLQGKSVSSVVETGHSLGGTEAQAGVAYLVDNNKSPAAVSGIVFNSPGIGKYQFKGASDSYKVIDLYDQGDAAYAAGGVHLGDDLVNLATGPTTGLLTVLTPASLATPPPLILGLLGTALYNDLGPAHSIDTVISYLTPPNGGDTIGAFNWTSSSNPSSIIGSSVNTTLPAFSVNGSGALVVTDPNSGASAALGLSSDGQDLIATFTGGASAIAQALDALGTVSVPLSELGQSLTSLTGASVVSETVSLNSNNSLDVDFQSGSSGSPAAGDQFSVSAPDAGSAFTYAVPSALQTVIENIDDGANSGEGSITVLGTSATQLTGGAAVSGQEYTWDDTNDDQYVFAPASANSSQGTLTITKGLLGSSGNTIVVDNFNLALAQSAAGYLGIYLPENIALGGGANAGGGSSGISLQEGSNASFTLSVDGPASTEQMIAVTLSAAIPSDFEVSVGGNLIPLSANGSFEVPLAAGASNVSFSLLDVTSDNGASDIASGATLHLTASLPNPINPSGAQISSAPVTINYAPTSWDTDAQTQPNDTIMGVDQGGGVTQYQGDGQNDYIALGGSSNNIVLAQTSGNDSIVGNGVFSAIYGGNGNDIIADNGATGTILTGDGDSEIYAGSKTGIASAIAAAASATATGAQGLVISALDGNNTIVGGDGNDYISVGAGSDIVVMGPGTDEFLGGSEITNVTENWYVSGDVLYSGDTDDEGFVNPYPQPYNGNEFADVGSGPTLLGGASDTIFAGTGSDLIYLGNGNNYVDMGSGNNSVAGGMGNDTIIAGSGTEYIKGGGGATYIEGGSGTETIYGGDGDNTIIGGSGNATIAASSYDNPVTGQTDVFADDTLVQNYVTGGSGDDVIYGSSGADTLIAGTGNTTIYGQSGNELIVGGSGDDLLQGGIGNSTIVAAGAGTDTLDVVGSSSSTSYLYGGDGQDSIEGGSGTNVLYAGDGGTAGAPTSVFASQYDSTATTTIYGGAGVDLLQGGTGSSVLYAGDGGTSEGATTLWADTGNTTMYGGLGTDLLQGGAGTDLLFAGDGGTTAAPTTVSAGAGVATLMGGAGPSILEDTQSGNDLLVSTTSDDSLVGIGNDTLTAGFGNDVLQANSGSVTFQINAGFGDDTILSMGGTENLSFGTGIAPTDFSGSLATDQLGNLDFVLTGDGGSLYIENALSGDLGTVSFADSGSISVPALLTDMFGGDTTIPSGSNNLYLNLGSNESTTADSNDDTISSWGSNDTLQGGNNVDEIYSAGSAAVIASGPGYDNIISTGNNASIQGGGVYGDAITVSGANSLVNAGSGSVAMTASGSNDSLIAGNGPDAFYVNASSEVIQDSLTGSNDTVYASVSYTAPTNVNSIDLTGSANIKATGNTGSDVLSGGAGIDTLISGSGIDTLYGGSNTTTYVVNNAADFVQDNSGTTGTLQASVSFTLPYYVDTLNLTGSTNLTGTGNGDNDTLVSNTGTDTLVGGTGNDTFVINKAGDVIQDTSSSSANTAQSSVSYTLPTNVNMLVLTGTSNLTGKSNSTDDTLVSNSGIDTLTGTAGNETFFINNTADVISDTSTTTNNTAISSVKFTLPANVNMLTLTGTAALMGTGNAGLDVIAANGGADTLKAGSGIATLEGGSGNDLFIVNNASDVVQDTSTTSSDTIQSAIGYTLAYGVNTLILTGGAAVAAGGNSGVDTIVSNTGKDTLSGEGGVNTFVVNNANDVLQELYGTSDTVQASVNFKLPTAIDTLILTGTANLVGTANSDTLASVVGNAGNDTLVAGSGFDTLVAGTGVDTLKGGTGRDVFVLNSASDVISVGSSFSDTVEASFSYTLPTTLTSLTLTGSANLVGAAASGANVITGNAGNDTLQAGSGSDTLVAGTGVDTLVGGSGSDTFVIDSASDVLQSLSGTGGNVVESSVSYTMASNINSLYLAGTANLVGTGNSAIDTITANSGNDTLVAGGGVAHLSGGLGADLFVVNNTSDTVSDTYFGEKGGIDTIQSSVSYSLPSVVNVLVLTGSGNLTATGNVNADSLVGNAGADSINAGTGNDTLVAGSGADTLTGSSGTDVFVINSIADVVRDSITGSNSALISSVSATLPTNVNILSLVGSASLLAVANSANDSLKGNAGADTLSAGTGNDTLVAGSGLTTLNGGAGSDTFIVNNSSDVVQNASATGHNVVLASSTFTLPTNVTVLTLTGIANIEGTGNSVSDTLTAGAGQDTLVAGGGAATLIGGAGNDTFVINSASDVVSDSSTTTNNAVQSSLNYTLPVNINTLILSGTAALKGTANSGNDTLVSNSGLDTLVGGSGNDTFVINQVGDVVQDTATAASNTAQASVSYTLTSNVNALILTGTSNLIGTANAAADTLIANSGADTLVGGSGSDTFVISNGLDIIQDTSTTAANAIVSSVSYSLPTNVNALTLSGTAALSAIGNSGADVITANGGNDTLTAGNGVATLIGGSGDDTFILNSANDVVQVSSTITTDSIQSSASFTLPTNVNYLTLTGTSNVTATANSANDTIVSNGGLDTLVGGSGNDLLIVNNAADVILDVTSSDTIESSVSFSLPSGAADLILIGSASIAGTGNGSGDTLTAGSGTDTLVAGSGAATMVGGTGNDTFVVNSASDLVEDSSATSSNSVQSSVSYSLPGYVDALTLTGTGNVTGEGNTDAANIITANAGDDVLVGTAGANTIYGAGADTIEAGPSDNLIYAGNEGTSSEPTYVYGNATGTSTSTENSIYGGSGADVVFGGAGSDLIISGSGDDTVYAGSGNETVYGSSGAGQSYIVTGTGTNLVYAGSGGTASLPTEVAGYDEASTTQSTIYGGSGFDVLTGGPGTDVIYAGSGTDTLSAGTGANSLYGAAGDLLTDSSSGRSLLVSGAGAETLSGAPGDTLIGGTGTDVLSSAGSSGAPTTYEINSGFGSDTITSPVSTSDDIAFGTGIAASSLSISASTVGSSGTAKDVALIINDGAGSIAIEGALLPGTINAVTYTGSGSESLTQFIDAITPVNLTLPYHSETDIFSTSNSQTLTAGANGSDIYAFGTNDVINQGTTGYAGTIYAYGNDAVVNDGQFETSVWGGGAGDTVNLPQSGSATLVGANDTAIASGPAFITVEQSSDVVQIGSGGYGNTVDALANFTLPSNVQTMIMDSAVGGLLGTSNSTGGTLVAFGNSDTLRGGAGHDTLTASGNNEVLAGGSGAEDYWLSNSTDTIQFGTAAASTATIDAEFNYTLPTSANNLNIDAANASGTGNNASDSLTAHGTGDTLIAGSGSDTLSDGGNLTTMIGGAGNDTFIVNANDHVQDSFTGTNNTVVAAVSFSLPTNVNALISAVAGVNLTANSGNDSITANGYNFDTLTGGSGTDTLVGNGTDETFVFNSGFGHQLITNPGQGSVIQFGSGITQASLTFTAIAGSAGVAPSLVISGTGESVTIQGGLVPGAISSVNFTGGASNTVPQLVAPTGRATITGASGNLILSPSNSDSVTGGSGQDTIDAWGNGDTLNAGTGGTVIYAGGTGDHVSGGTGTDSLIAIGANNTLIGGSGNESLFVNDPTTVIQVTAGVGHDTVISSVGYSLPPNANVLVLTGTAGLTATGNSGNDSITANAGPDYITSGTGIDTLIAGTGNDLFIVNNASDVLQDSTPASSSIIDAPFSFTLPPNFYALGLTGTANLTGTGNAQNCEIVGNSGDDTLTAGAGADELFAGSSTNTLVSGSGVDTINVGSFYGAGEFVEINNSADVITGNTEISTLETSVNYTLPAGVFAPANWNLMGSANLVASFVLNGGGNVTGNAGSDTLIGGASSNGLTAGTGVDTLIGGGTGSFNVFYVNNAADVVVAQAGATNTVSSSVSYTLPANVGTFDLTGTAALTAVANSGNDTLSSNSGVDTLVGGSGNDTFNVNNGGDIVQDTSATASNTINSSFSYSLPSNVNSLVLNGSGGIKGTANSGNDTLTSLSNSLTTTLAGGAGNDTFVVNTSDVIQDSFTTTNNTVETPYSWTLPTNVNGLILTGSLGAFGVGNSANDSLTANAGNDSLIAGNGTDTLVSGTGTDSLVGGTGNDVFVVNNGADVVSVGSTHGSDTIQASVTYTASPNVANLTLTGTGNLSATGNTLSNVLTANSGTDTLTAASGIATLVGGSGNDTFVVDASSDVVQDGSTSTSNTIQSSVSYTLPTNVNNLTFTGATAVTGTANSGNDTLNSNTGADTLVGGGGNDTFLVSSTSDVIKDTFTSTSNAIQSSVTYSLPTNVNALVLTGTAALGATGNAGNDLLTANTGADTLSAGSGTDTLVSGTGSQADSLVGGSGNDLFIVNYASDVVSVVGTHGNDTIQASVSYTLPANVANLALTGTGNLSAKGNALSDVLSANSGADTLTAATGIATLVGGSGNDTFVLNASSDVVQDSSTSASNTIQSSVNYTLPTNVNNLTFTGTAAVTGTANSGNDILTSNTGIDTLVGGSGSETFVVKNASDVVQDTSAAAANLIQSSVSFTLPTDVNSLTLTGTVALSGTGNAANDVLTANSGADTLSAGNGTDTLSSGVGIDSLVGGTGTDTFVVNNASDAISVASAGNDSVQSSVSYTLPNNVAFIALTGTHALKATGNSLTDLLIGNTGNDTLTGGSGIAALEAGTAGNDSLKAISNQAALIGGGAADTLTGGAYKDFYAAGMISGAITTGATANVISYNEGDGATTINPTVGANNVLSLGAGVDTESLTFTKSGNNLILGDGVAGDSVTFSNWYSNVSNQVFNELQVVELASSDYSAASSDPLRNQAIEEFNFASLVSQFNNEGSPANWSLLAGMPSAQLTSSASAAYGGDLAYYFGLNGNLTDVNLSAVQSTLTNSSYGTGTQTIDSFGSISGGGIHLDVIRQPTKQNLAQGIVTPSDLSLAIARVQNAGANRNVVGTSEQRVPELRSGPDAIPRIMARGPELRLGPDAIPRIMSGGPELRSAPDAMPRIMARGPELRSAPDAMPRIMARGPELRSAPDAMPRIMAHGPGLRSIAPASIALPGISLVSAVQVGWMRSLGKMDSLVQHQGVQEGLSGAPDFGFSPAVSEEHLRKYHLAQSATDSTHRSPRSHVE